MMSIKNFSTVVLKAELKRREEEEKLTPKMKEGWPDSPIGTWKVTTENDIEGRTTKTLGFFEGHIVDIALQLSKHSAYCLTFHPVTDTDIVYHNVKDGDTVSVVLDISSGTWDIHDAEKRAETVKAWFSKAMTSRYAYDVAKHNYYASVKITALYDQSL